MLLDEELLSKVKSYVKGFMSNYDPSHDWTHIERVVNLAQYIQEQTPGTDRDTVTLCALLHDVGDKKYIKPGDDPTTQIHKALIDLGAPETLASKIQTICLGVSYSSEIKDPNKVINLIQQYPELAVVQDADRLDAIGAVGIGRAFAFGGAKNRPLSQTMEHFEEKFVHLASMMKTDAGKKLAVERTRRIHLMQEWWAEETAPAVNGHS